MSITPETLIKFSSFRQLPEEQLQKLLDAGEFKLFQSAPGEKMITRGSTDEFSFFLLNGALKLIAKDGQTAIIKSDSESAKQPITQLRPRQYDVIADSAVDYLKIKNQVLETLTANTESSLKGIQVENDHGHADIYFQLYHDIKRDHVNLTSLPNVASRINSAIAATEKMDAKRLGQLIMSDPAVATKVIKLAISSKEADSDVALDNISQIINHLGVVKTIEIVRVLTLKDIFKPINAIHEHFIKDMWREAMLVSAIAGVLADEFEHLDPRKAQLVGLCHNVGIMLIAECLGKDRRSIADESQVQAIVTELGGNISAMLLEKWNFDSAFINAAKDAQNWQRSNEGKPLDYSDLIIVAKLLSYVTTPKMEQSPVLTELAVFRKLNWGKNGVAQGLQILKKAKINMQALTQGFEQK